MTTQVARPKTLRSRSLLFIDDSSSIRNHYLRALTDLGYEVHACEEGHEALELARRTRIDCIVTDYEHPGLSGPELCREVKKDDRLQEIPIILLTSHSSVEHVIDGIEAGADEYVVRSDDIRELDIRIRAMIRLRDLRDELISLRRLSAIRSMITTYNHEFNNALVIAYGALEKLGVEVGDEAQKELEKMKSSLERIQRTVERISAIDHVEEVGYAGTSTMVSLPSK